VWPLKLTRCVKTLLHAFAVVGWVHILHRLMNTRPRVVSSPIVSPPMISKKCVQQVRVKGTVVNARTTMDGMVIALIDLDGNSVMVHTSVVCLFMIRFG